MRYLHLCDCDCGVIPESSLLDSLSMAKIPRKAKSGNDWDEVDLVAYNIRVEFQDAATFFETPRLPDPVLKAKEVLEVTKASQTTTDDGYALLRVAEAATYPRQNQESAVHDFAAELFRACGYTGRGRLVRTRKDIYVLTCSEDKYTKVDACILNDMDEVILLVHEDKWHFDNAILSHPECQLIAEAIAAFAANTNELNDLRSCRSESPPPPCQFKVMPGIILNGTSPTFYKIPVSKNLVTAVKCGQYPKQETVVLAHTPDVLPRTEESMYPLENRRVILSCFEAFKRFVK